MTSYGEKKFQELTEPQSSLFMGGWELSSTRPKVSADNFAKSDEYKTNLLDLALMINKSV